MEFGILGTANIAQNAVIPAIQSSKHAVGAIASRDAKRAGDVATVFEISRHYGSYERLLEDDAIDAIYIPLPNALHAEWVKRAADAGFDVLCEKPIAVDAEEAREIVNYCQNRDVTLMEAFMYRYHPRTERALEIVDEALDDVRSVTAVFDWPVRDQPDNVRLSPELAGGSLMDVGCYAVSIARQFLGEPTATLAHATDSRETGVETDIAGILISEDGSSARIAAGFDTRIVQHYRVEATNGWLEVDEAFVPSAENSTELEYQVDGRHAVETFEPIDQYRLEVEHFARCVEQGARPRTDGEEAIANMGVIDALYNSAEDGEHVPVDPVR